MKAVSSEGLSYRLNNTHELTGIELRQAIEAGAKFKLYHYRISLGLVTLTRFSPATMIVNPNEERTHIRKYNIITLLFGPWFLPSLKGPFLAYRTIRANLDGGMDVTGDVLLNVDTYDPTSKEIRIEYMHTLFSKLDRSNLKELKKSFRQKVIGTPAIDRIYAAKFINVDEDTEPPYYIGVDSELELDTLEEILRPAILKRFHKFVEFEIFKASDDPELFDKIQEQGDLVSSSK